MTSERERPLRPGEMSEADYKALWGKLGLEIKMVRQDGKCRHKLGDIFRYESPYKRPEGVCFALLYVLDLYTWRCALGFPSWEADDREVFRIHCPSKNGTVWEMRKLSRTRENGQQSTASAD